MEKLYRLLVIKFDCLTAKCLFPLIINWEDTQSAAYEKNIIDKIIQELEGSLLITKVRVVHNKVDHFSALQSEFDSIIGDIDYNTEISQLRVLNVHQKTFLQLTYDDMNNGLVEKFHLTKFAFPIRVSDPEKITLQEFGIFPILVIEP